MKRLLAMFALTMVLSPAVAGDEKLPVPKGPVILTVEGEISRFNDGERAVFDRAMLEQLGIHVTQTTTPWADGQQRYEGPLVRKLLEAVGAKGDTLDITALNDYSAPAPIADYYDHDVILALKENGAYMRVRDKGPLFIVYPFETSPELNNEVHYNRSVWQIKTIRVQ